MQRFGAVYVTPLCRLDEALDMDNYCIWILFGHQLHHSSVPSFKTYILTRHKCSIPFISPHRPVSISRRPTREGDQLFSVQCHLPHGRGQLLSWFQRRFAPTLPSPGKSSFTCPISTHQPRIVPGRQGKVQPEIAKVYCRKQIRNYQTKLIKTRTAFII